MKKYIFGNWKANKNISEVNDWFKLISTHLRNIPSEKLKNVEIAVCPPFIYLPFAKEQIEKLQLPLKLCAQDVSPFTNGAFTGEVSAKQLSEFVDYILIGHSERRTYFKEDQDLLSQKVSQTIGVGLKPILCIPDEKTPVVEKVDIVAYEPVWAIGTGKADTPENANSVALRIKNKNYISTLIYGGSVKPDNIKSFLTTTGIDGVLPGGASLNPQSFFEMVVNAVSI